MSKENSESYGQYAFSDISIFSDTYYVSLLFKNIFQMKYFNLSHCGTVKGFFFKYEINGTCYVGLNQLLSLCILRINNLIVKNDPQLKSIAIIFTQIGIKYHKITIVIEAFGPRWRSFKNCFKYTRATMQVMGLMAIIKCAHNLI
jgi:hypothetical protein